MDCSPWNSPGHNTGMGSLSLLQGISPTQGLNPGLLHCRWILYQLSHKGSPRVLVWVAYPFSRGFSWLRNWTGVSCLVGGFFTNWAIREFRNALLCQDTKWISKNRFQLYWNTFVYEHYAYLFVSPYSWKDFTKLMLFSHLVMSDSLWPHGLQPARLPCPSPPPGACLNSCPLSQWCHPTISSSVIHFSSCLPSFSASGSFLMSRLFTSGGQSTGASASASVLIRELIRIDKKQQKNIDFKK